MIIPLYFDCQLYYQGVGQLYLFQGFFVNGRGWLTVKGGGFMIEGRLFLSSHNILRKLSVWLFEGGRGAWALIAQSFGGR